jgi:hypothetical protein
MDNTQGLIMTLIIITIVWTLIDWINEKRKSKKRAKERDRLMSVNKGWEEEKERDGECVPDADAPAHTPFQEATTTATTEEVLENG